MLETPVPPRTARSAVTPYGFGVGREPIRSKAEAGLNAAGALATFPLPRRSRKLAWTTRQSRPLRHSCSRGPTPRVLGGFAHTPQAQGEWKILRRAHFSNSTTHQAARPTANT